MISCQRNYLGSRQSFSETLATLTFEVFHSPMHFLPLSSQGKQNNSSPPAKMPTCWSPQTREYATSQSPKGFAAVMKDLETGKLSRTQQNFRVRGVMTTEAEVGVTRCHGTQEVGSLWRLEKAGNQFSPRASRRKARLILRQLAGDSLTSRTVRREVCVALSRSICYSG